MQSQWTRRFIYALLAVATVLAMAWVFQARLSVWVAQKVVAQRLAIWRFIARLLHLGHLRTERQTRIGRTNSSA